MENQARPREGISGGAGVSLELVAIFECAADWTAQAMKRILLSLLLFCLPAAALADGIVIPTVAFPAKVTIPDQRALIHFTNGTERLVIETRFTGAGTNFAWVVPLPSQPVIEEATTGLFPTLQYLFRPEIVHNVTRYYAGILALMGIGYLLLFVRPTGRLKWLDILACVCAGIAAGMVADRHGDVFNETAFGVVAAILFCDVILVRIAQRSAFAVFGLTFFGFFLLSSMLLPALGVASKGMVSTVSAESISILDRKLVGIFETTTISSHDPKALENWLRANGFSLSTNAGPVIASYVKDGWVFVAAKIRRDQPDNETSTPHPLSFTFKTDKPVYPMRLTGLNSPPLTIALYVFGNTCAAAPHFKVESYTRLHPVHSLLRQWVGDSAVATKLTATLSSTDMRKDVWLDQTPFVFEHRNRFFSQHGALTIALNWGAGVFAAGLFAVCLVAFVGATHKTKLPRQIGIVTLTSLFLVGLIYLSLPKIEVKLGRGHFYYQTKEEVLALRIALSDSDWHTAAEVRTGFQKIISNPTNAQEYGLQNWDNPFVGGQFHEEDSPGNYLLRETNNQLQIVTFNRDGAEEVQDTWDLPARH
jgi:hypothetical protein